MGIYFVDEVEVTVGGTGDYYDVDLDTYVANLPSGVTGVYLRIINTKSDSEYKFSVRKNGSTDDFYQSIIRGGQTTAFIGVDENKVFEAKIEDSTYIDIYICAYFTTGFTFLDNGVDKTPSSNSAWITTDCSVSAPSAVGLFFICTSTSYDFTVGVANHGWHGLMTARSMRYNNYFGIITGCSDTQKCSIYCEDVTQVKFYLIGYMTSAANVCFDRTDSDRTLSSTGSYYDLVPLPTRATAGIFYCRVSGSTYKINLRKNGSSLDKYYSMRYACIFIVECDSNRLVEGKTADYTPGNIILIGYFYSEGLRDPVTDDNKLRFWEGQPSKYVRNNKIIKRGCC